MSRLVSLARPTLAACLVAGAFGCAAEEPGFAVSSDPADDLLARITYLDGARVDFRGNPDDGVLVAAVVPDGVTNPVDGVSLGGAVPSALFEALTGTPAPAALRAAEGEDRAARAPEARLFDGPPVSASTFATEHCFPRIDFCQLNQTGNQTLRSPRRVDGVEGAIAAGTGALRARVYSKKLVGSDKLLATYGVSDALVSIGAWTPGVDRDMRVVIDQTDGVVYHVSADFRD